jgi:hypothetical protein
MRQYFEARRIGGGEMTEAQLEMISELARKNETDLLKSNRGQTQFSSKVFRQSTGGILAGWGGTSGTQQARKEQNSLLRTE